MEETQNMGRVRSPSRSNNSLPVSAVEWMPSESMAELPVRNATMYLKMAIMRLDAIAPYTAIGFLEDVFCMW